MTLIKCPECKNKVSEFALNCPNCGFILSEEIVQKIKAEKDKKKSKKRERREFLDSFEVNSHKENYIPKSNDEAKKVKKGKGDKFGISLIILIILFIVVLSYIIKHENKTLTNNITSEIKTGTLKYEIVEKKDISYLNTPRMVYRILLNVDIVPTDEEIKEISKKIWENGNKHWKEFTEFFYLPDMDVNGSAYCTSEYTDTGLKSFVSGIGREVGTKVIKLDNGELKKEVSPDSKNEEIKYVNKELNGWKYREVVSISTSKRQRIFYDLVKYQDDTGEDVKAYSVIAKKYGISEDAVNAIAGEGALKRWSMP